jgi:hypothetical protein
MIGVVAAFLLLAGGHQSQFPGVLGKGGSIKLPPPIDEQVRPYRTCLLGEFERNPRFRTGGSEGMQAAKAQAMAACAEARRTAATASDSALRSVRAYRKEAKRRATIEKYLADLDAGLLPLYLATTPAPAPRPGLTEGQAAIVYDQCLARAAAQASRTEAPDDQIYPAARAACAETRAMLLRDSTPDARPALDSIDAERAASFPERTRRLREMRRAREQQEGRPN